MAGAALCEPQSAEARSAEHFVNLEVEVQISWQAPRSVNLEVQISWQASKAQQSVVSEACFQMRALMTVLSDACSLALDLGR